MPAPHYDARTVTAPDGTRITVAYTTNSRLANLTDAEFLAEVRPTLAHAEQYWPKGSTQTERPSATVTNLAAERIRRRGHQLPHGRP